MRYLQYIRGVALLALAALLASCGGGDGGIGGTGARQGTLNVALADAPGCGWDAVNVTVQKIAVHQSAAASDTDAGWSEINVPADKQRVNLLDLTNGVLQELGQVSLPAGTYTQLRLVLAPNDGSTPIPNSVIPTGGSETELSTPSGQQSGLKLNVDIEVPAGEVADVVLDFDACKSVVQAGNSGRYSLKPVIRVIPRLSDAGLRVVGWVDPSIAASANVSLQSTATPVEVVRATAPAADGQFVLYPVPAGTYSLVVASAGHATAVMTGVPVVSGTPTQVNSAAVPIAPAAAASAPRSVQGSVSPATATVRALQTFSGGPTFEAAWGSVDATTGAFAFSLPVDAPLRTAYAANPATLDFTPDPAAAAQYVMEAASGTTTQQQAVDAGATVPDLSFVFP